MKLDKFDASKWCREAPLQNRCSQNRGCKLCIKEAAHKFYQEQVDKAMAEKVALIDAELELLKINIEFEGMKAENRQREVNGFSPAYREGDFNSLLKM